MPNEQIGEERKSREIIHWRSEALYIQKNAITQTPFHTTKE